MAQFSTPSSSIEQRSGYCPSTSTFHSKRPPIPLPPNQSVDITTFISARPHGGVTAFIDASTGRRLSYPDLWQAVDAVAFSLSSMGIKKNDVVLILSPNSIYFPIVCLSVMSLGALITTTNPLNTKTEIAKQIADSKPKLAFTTAELLPKLADSNIPIVLLGDSDGRSDFGGLPARILTTLDELVKADPGESGLVRERVCQNDAAALLYSSGTTGASKGVISSHRNMIAMVQTVINRFRLEENSESHKIFVCTVPMFHIYGLVAFATGLLAAGATIVVLPKFEMNDLLQAISKYKVSYFPLVPPILVAMVNHADQLKRSFDLSSLRRVLSGGAPLGKELTEGFVAKFPGVSINQGYGLTESTAIGASTDSLEESRRYGTAGMLSPSMEAKIVDPESGKALGINQTGELWLRGPTVMKGYFNNPEATASTLTSDGWLKTGDLCYFDEDGFLFVVDRLKELIKYKGYQVPPAELEALLLTHPQIADAAVIPFPDEEVGQFPMAYVVRKPGTSLSENEIMDFAAKQVAPYKRIRRVAFVPSIPKNPSGKILRKDLIKMAISGSKL